MPHLHISTQHFKKLLIDWINILVNLLNLLVKCLPYSPGMSRLNIPQDKIVHMPLFKFMFSPGVSMTVGILCDSFESLVCPLS